MTLLVAGVLALAGCTDGAAEPEASPPSTRTAPDTRSSPDATPIDTPAEPAAADRAPLGLDVRYVDENGKFVVLPVESFPR